MNDRTNQREGILPYLFIFLIVLTAYGVLFYLQQDLISARVLSIDYDGYLHLLRVQEIHHNGHWDNDLNLRGNAPYGERLHWTRAMDLVLLCGAWVGSFFTDFDTSLFWWGVFVGPFLYVVSLCAIIGFGRAILPSGSVLFLALVFVANSQQIVSVYAVNRPDHHCLVATFFLFAYITFILLLKRPQSSGLCLLSAFVSALGLWSSLESIALIGVSIAFLGLMWIVRGRVFSRTSFIYSLSLAGFVMITIFMDEPSGRYWTVAYDRRSVFHVVFFLLVALYWTVALLIERRRPTLSVATRIGMALVGGLAIGAVISAVFPDAFGGPMAAMDTRLTPLFLSQTGEFAPPSLALFASNILVLAPGLIYLAYATISKPNETEASRVLYWWLMILIVFYGALGTTLGRWMFTARFISILPNTLLLIPVLKWEKRWYNAVAAFALTFVVIGSPFLVSLALDREGGSSGLPYHKLRAMLPFYHESGSDDSTDNANAIRKRRGREYDLALAATLAHMQTRDRTTERAIVLADIYVGHAIMYLTDFDVVGTPNHSNAAGILDTWRLVGASDDETAHSIVLARGIDYILIDDGLRHLAVIVIDDEEHSATAVTSGTATTFVDRLDSGRRPDWLVPEELPDELAGTFDLYRVVELKSP